MNNYINEILKKLNEKHSHEQEYVNVVKDFADSIIDFIKDKDDIKSLNIIERLIYPDRVISFKVPWVDDNNVVNVNTGYRVQFNQLLGPYKGGIRFDPSVNESILKFLAFEQTFKNSLTNLPIGGAKGGADFDPRGKSDFEIMRFCQSYMTELYKYLGPDIDVPAGDLGVGQKEVGYMFGMYKKLATRHNGVFTSKHLSSGGSILRPEATGYGLIYITNKALKTYYNTSIENKSVIISGSGNVGINAAYKARELGAKVIAISSIDGIIHDENGVDINLIDDLNKNKIHIKNYCNTYQEAIYLNNPKDIWMIKADIYLPCATQNEINNIDALFIVKNNPLIVAEGANKPSTTEAIEIFKNNKILHIPSKAANAGGVATSTFEMNQNATHSVWTKQYVDQQIKLTMENIFDNIYFQAQKLNDSYNLEKAANIYSFVKIYEAMKHQGI